MAGRTERLGNAELRVVDSGSAVTRDANARHMKTRANTAHSVEHVASLVVRRPKTCQLIHTRDSGPPSDLSASVFSF